MTKSTITIGIDSSTKCCGVAIFENGDLINISHLDFDGIYNVEKLKTMVKRFEEIFSEYNPDIVLIEEPAPCRHSKAVTSLNQVAGAIMAVAIMYNATVDYVHNQTIKKLMSIKTKEDSIKKAKKIYPDMLRHYKMVHDEADAILVVESYKEIIK